MGWNKLLIKKSITGGNFWSLPFKMTKNFKIRCLFSHQIIPLLQFWRKFLPPPNHQKRVKKNPLYFLALWRASFFLYFAICMLKFKPITCATKIVGVISIPASCPLFRRRRKHFVFFFSIKTFFFFHRDIENQLIVPLICFFAKLLEEGSVS